MRRRRERVPHGSGALERRPERSRGACTAVVGVCSVGIRGGPVVGAGYLVGEKGVWARGVVGVSVAGVRVRDAPLPLRWVTVRFGGA
jgi:hypothetical protein